MSWDQAKRDAEKWLESLRLSKVKGNAVNLGDRGDTLKHEGGYRAMVLVAARRILVKRGASHISLPD